MKKVLILKGLPASGKTTFAKELLAKEPGKWKRINKDDLRDMLDNGKWSKANENFVVQVRNGLIVNALAAGFNVIVDDTNLHPKHEKNIRDMVSLINSSVLPKQEVVIEVKDFTNVPLEECIKRDQQRQNYAGEKVIRRMYNDFVKPEIPKVKPNLNLPDAILVDLDGTLALFGNKNPYDRDFENDELNEAVASVIPSLQEDVYPIFVSGRDSKYRNVTLDWLSKKLYWDRKDLDKRLFMRPEGDKRKDAIVKKEIYEAHIKDKYNVLFILDDRNQMVEMWRDLGLTCFQVAGGDF